MIKSATRALSFATFISTVALVVAGRWVVATPLDVNAAPILAQDESSIRSDVLAAVLAALQFHELKPGSRSLQPSALLNKDWVVSWTASGQGKVTVAIRPAATRVRGGGVRYVVDASSLAILETVHEQ